MIRVWERVCARTWPNKFQPEQSSIEEEKQHRKMEMTMEFYIFNHKYCQDLFYRFSTFASGIRVECEWVFAMWYGGGRGSISYCIKTRIWANDRARARVWVNCLMKNTSQRCWAVAANARIFSAVINRRAEGKFFRWCHPLFGSSHKMNMPNRKSWT